jgi:hypothetical protein
MTQYITKNQIYDYFICNITQRVTAVASAKRDSGQLNIIYIYIFLAHIHFK